MMPMPDFNPMPLQLSEYLQAKYPGYRPTDAFSVSVLVDVYNLSRMVEQERIDRGVVRLQRYVETLRMIDDLEHSRSVAATLRDILKDF